ncbi:hypothetical protein DQ04_06861000 [Trypanosoma grayi]|uniref:hypothetical protein n=1 Tax=Trypanosoma grayi TaxID=71804 RepID=UPI0004F49D47|nr:hypothetical protein DQ04_06861000 [Trypanosoma grayi]KEG08584.1 hypothetical protein DQ04_06861000 [Trypanosoma grayi]
MQRVLHAQRQAETEHRTAVEQWRNKTEEQGQAMRRTERALAEERAAQQERREKTDMLVAQLKKLAEQTRRFKEVTDTLAEWLHMSTRQPEEVLARLKEKMAEEHP